MSLSARTTVSFLWAALLWVAPSFFLGAYLPGYCAGLLLCGLHGHYEHAGGTISHRGALYNLLFLNDGYHMEHHAHPGEHWTRLPAPFHLRPGPASRTDIVLRIRRAGRAWIALRTIAATH